MSLNSMLIILLVAVMATSISHGQNTVGIVHVTGTLYCSPNGRPGTNPTPVFPNTLIEVVCTADVLGINPATATTDASGAYLVILIPRNNATVESITSNCRVYVPAPLSSCNPALPSSGLVSNLQFVRTVPAGFSRLTYMVPASFTVQT